MKEDIHTSELYFNLTVNKFISTENLPKTTPFVVQVSRWMTKWKAVIIVCFLWIVIRPNLIYPEGNRVIRLVLHEEKKNCVKKE